MSLVEDRQDNTTLDAQSSVIRRGNDDQWWWMAFVTVIAMVALAMSIVSFALYASKDTGGDGGDSGGGAAATPAAALTITAKEFSFSPKAVSAKSGTDVAVTLKNSGAVEHEWTVLKSGTRITKEADYNESMVAVKIGPAASGETVNGTANLEAGVYQVICSIKGHFDAGMAGTLTVS